MKSSSSFLWELIQSMSRSEKLYFKRNFSGSSGEKLYLQLFSAIAAQKAYDETAILKKFHPHLNKKNIAYQKYYLQRQVTEALVMYDTRESDIHSIYSQILLIRVYRKKGLTREAHTLWEKTLAAARATESFGLLNILKTEFEKMILSGSVHTRYDEMHAVFKKNLIPYEEYKELITLRDIYTEVLLLKRKNHYDFDAGLKEKVEELLDQVNNSRLALHSQSFWYRHYYRLSKASLLYLLNDFSEALPLLEQSRLDWKENSKYIATHTEFYNELLYMINYAGILHGSYDWVIAAFNDKLNDGITDPVQRAAFEANKYLALNKIYNKTANYDEAEKLVRFMKSRYKQWEALLNPDLNRTLCLSLGIGCFVLEQMNDALAYTKRAITYFKDGTREEHASVAQLLLLLITYSLNNARLFDAQYRATYTYFYKQKKKHPFEKALVQCLHKSFYSKDLKTKILEYRKALQVLEDNKDDLVQQMSLKIFNYHGWLQSRIQRIPYRKYVEKKVKTATTEAQPVL